MDPTLLLAGAAFVALLRQRQQPALPAPTAPATTDQGQGTSQGRGGPGVKDLVGAAGTVAGTAAGALPAGVTAIAATAAKVVGVAVAAGATAIVASEGGGAIDNALAPDMNSKGGVSGAIARGAVGGAAFVVTAIAGLAAFKLIAVSVLLTALSGTGVGVLLAAAVWFISVAIENLSALSWGQPGALRDLKGTHFAFKTIFTGLLDKRFGKGGTLEPEMAARFAEQMACGYVAQWNRLRYETWMLDKAWGLGATRLNHAQWGHKRGYFYGVLTPDGYLWTDNNPIPDVPVSGLALDPAWVEANVPAAERVTRTGKIRKIVFEVVTHAIPPDLAKFGVKPWTSTEWKMAFEEKTVVVDSMLDNCLRVGRNLANAMAYVKWMGPSERQFFGPVAAVKDSVHAEYGRRHGRFHGDLDAEGRLVQTHPNGEKTVLHWRDGVLR